jgi:pyruvate,water dikinase
LCRLPGECNEGDDRQATDPRAQWERARRLTPPVSLPLKAAPRFLGIDITQWMPAHSHQAEGDTIKGIAASPGRVAGRARVIHGSGEFGQMQAGPPARPTAPPPRQHLDGIGYTSR